MKNNTEIRAASTHSIVATVAGTEELPTPSPDNKGTYLINISNTGDPTSSISMVYIVAAGSLETSSARIIRPGTTASYGPCRIEHFPDLYISDAVTVLVSYDIVFSEG